MNANNAIGKTFVSIRDILSDEEKKNLAQMWSAGVSKNWIGADMLLRQNLVECIFTRRLDPKEGYRSTRHMLCTRNFILAEKLAKIRGLRMDVKSPRGNGWYQQRKIILVCDVVACDFRMINLEDPNEWRILDFVPFRTVDEFRQVANLWTTYMKKVIPYGPGWRSYCNLIRKGL